MHSYDTLPDHVLFDLVRLEDETAFKAIYDRYFDMLHMHAYKRLKDKEESRDVVQEIFTALWIKREELELRGSLQAYLHTSVRNRIFNILAHKRIESAHLQSLQQFINQGACQTDHRVRESEMNVLIEEGVAGLPSKMQEIFELSRKQYLSHKEIAAELNLSEQTVKKQVSNALKILRTKLGVLFLLLAVFF